MGDKTRTILERITAGLESFYYRLAACVKRNNELLINMRNEEDFGKSMGYLKEFFCFKKEV